jgi:hypothetical protein
LFDQDVFFKSFDQTHNVSNLDEGSFSCHDFNGNRNSALPDQKITSFTIFTALEWEVQSSTQLEMIAFSSAHDFISDPFTTTDDSHLIGGPEFPFPIFVNGH